MNIFAAVDAKVRSALNSLKADGQLGSDVGFDGIEIQEPRDPAHGDVASNAALVLARRAGLKPRDLAEALSRKLLDDKDIAAADVAGPGFLNIRLAECVWQQLLQAILNDPASFGRVGLGTGRRVHIEFVSANPTGPMHIGHCRGAVFGDTLARLLGAAGFDVTREYYINDAGAQVDKLGLSALLRYREALGGTIGDIPEGLYPGEYLKTVGEALVERYQGALLERPEADAAHLARDLAIELMLEDIKRDLAALGVRHDVFFSERALTEAGRDQVKAAIEKLRARGYIYEGHLPRPKGHDDEEWEDREQTLFRSTDFGDDVDRALMKSDGSYTYFAADVAYHDNKVERGYDHYVNVLGADHIGYVPRIKAAVRALSPDPDHPVDFETPICNLVKVVRDGEPVRMSKRAGTFVELRDVVDEVGRDPVRFMMLMNKPETQIDFDLAKVVEQSKDNPVFYVQYAHARIASVLRKAFDEGLYDPVRTPSLSAADSALLADPGERDLLRLLSRYPRAIENAAREREPHRIPRYLYELASALHGQWAKGNDSPHLRFIRPDAPETTRARLALVHAVKTVIGLGLALVGVSAPEEM